MTDQEKEKIYKLLLTHINHNMMSKGTATAAEDGEYDGYGDMCGPVIYSTPKRKLSMKLPALGTIEETTAFAEKMIDQLIIIEDAIESIESHIDKRK